MANPQREDGKVQYELERPALSFRIPASNRQKKLLRFFDVPFSPKISAGAAGWETATVQRIGFAAFRGAASSISVIMRPFNP